MLAGDRRRIGRGILTIVLLVVGMFAFNIGLSLATALIDRQMGHTPPTLGGTDHTLLFHFSNLFSIALLIPWSMCLQRWLYGVRGPSLHSVVSRVRFDLIGRSLLFIGPVWLAVSLIVLSFRPVEQAAQSSAYLLALLAITLLVTPLQGAGEEYGYRGLVLRIASSWNRGPRTALVVGVLLSSLVFSLVHLSLDPWFNLWTFSLAVSMAVITWRTGGLEIACVVHALNNTLTYLLLIVLHADQSAAVERSAGSGSAIMVLPCAVVIAIAVVVWLRTRGTGPALTPHHPQSQVR
ncbi:CPBP family intramembrane glutamic endopeptidase [Nocardiopsis sp. MG754419]|uniref:CPBP family intramembrane glutamic endopeptidase n=1 Tax=Nocardiopsis sp. MG754419 TaxID=2259865 RepID=UPI0027DB3F66|nr:CPBP family intramembrane glutamic endopeptidase [Nocardiopsis sp. MG754419]